MQQSGLLLFLAILVIGIFSAALLIRHFRARFSEDSAPNFPPTEKAREVFIPNDPSVRSPAGSMAARREDIEDLLRGKEDQHS